MSKSTDYETPNLDKKDFSFLKKINEDYTPNAIRDIKLSEFKSKYLDMLLREQSPEQYHIARETWIREVSKNPRLPVRVVKDDDPDYIVHIVPPMLGTIQTGKTATAVSINSRFMYMEQEYRRLVSAGDAVAEVLYDNIPLVDDSEYMYKLAWYQILKTYGYIKEENNTTDKNGIDKTTQPVQDYEEDEDDFVY